MGTRRASHFPGDAGTQGASITLGKSREERLHAHAK